MASSKFPVDEVMVSDDLISFALECGSVVCNPWPEQLDPPPSFIVNQGQMVDELFIRFLKELPPGARVVLHFQGYGPEVATAVIDLKSVLYSEGNYPRLDFDRPPLIQSTHGAAGFWGRFVLAIARVLQGTPLQCESDPDASLFKRIARENGIVLRLDLKAACTGLWR